jgi:hypothetical protein
MGTLSLTIVNEYHGQRQRDSDYANQEQAVLRFIHGSMETGE